MGPIGPDLLDSLARSHAALVRDGAASDQILACVRDEQAAILARAARQPDDAGLTSRASRLAVRVRVLATLLRSPALRAAAFRHATDLRRKRSDRRGRDHHTDCPGPE